VAEGPTGKDVPLESQPHCPGSVRVSLQIYSKEQHLSFFFLPHALFKGGSTIAVIFGLTFYIKDIKEFIAKHESKSYEELKIVKEGNGR